MARRTKAQLEKRIEELEQALDLLLASHKDCLSGLTFNQRLRKKIEREVEMVRFDL